MAYIWAKTVLCSACNQHEPGVGSEYYSGDQCRCADCIKAGRELPYQFGSLEGIIGVTIPQFEGQLRKRR